MEKRIYCVLIEVRIRSSKTMRNADVVLGRGSPDGEDIGSNDCYLRTTSRKYKAKNRHTPSKVKELRTTSRTPTRTEHLVLLDTFVFQIPFPPLLDTRGPRPRYTAP